jgi:hypothetical protein
MAKKVKENLVAKIKEVSLPFNTSYGALKEYLQDAIEEDLGVQSIYDSNSPCIIGVFANNVVYDFDGDIYRRPYTITYGAGGEKPAVTLSDRPVKCHVAYMDNNKDSDSIRVIAEVTKESVIITHEPLEQVHESGDSVICFTAEQFSSVKEAKISANVPIKIISSGWGSHAYYPKSVLMRDGPKVFKKGTHMYWNHATETEEMERPEGDLNALAAVLIKDAVWDDNGPKGPGLYSEAKVFSDYAQQVSDKGPHIGVSINAGIRAHDGEAEGRKGKIADQFVVAYSTDFVTKAGAGGAPIVSVLESDRRNKEVTEMTEQEIKDMNDLKEKIRILEASNVKLMNDNAALIQGQNVVLAVTTVGSVLKESGISFNRKILERACQNPVIKDGKLDQDWLKSVVSDFSEGVTGRVTGMGQGKATSSKEDGAKALESAFRNLGLSDAGLKYAVDGGA